MKHFIPFSPFTRRHSFNKHEHGNVLILIMLGVAMFAALTYAVSSGMRGGGSTVTNEQSRVAAGEILRFHSQVRNAVTQLIYNGCSESELDFQNSTWKRMDDTVIVADNPNAPADGRCSIFHPNGAGLAPQTFANGSLHPSDTTSTASVVPGHSSASVGRAKEIGDDDLSELIFSTMLVTKQVCEAVNKSVGINDGVLIATDNDGTNSSTYAGTFPTFGDYYYGGAGEEDLDGQRSACVQSSPTGWTNNKTYYVYTIIYER